MGLAKRLHTLMAENRISRERAEKALRRVYEDRRPKKGEQLLLFDARK